MIDAETRTDAPHLYHVERAPRIVTTLLVGKLMCERTVQQICRIRNISATGMLVESPLSLARDNQVSVELRSGEKLEGRVAWAEPGRAGVQFNAPIEVDRVLSEARSGVRAGEAAMPRAPRFDVHFPARLIHLGRGMEVLIENISQTGARLRLSGPATLDHQITLHVPGLTPRHAHVRWSIEDEVGIAFVETISYNELSAWLGHGGKTN